MHDLDSDSRPLLRLVPSRPRLTRSRTQKKIAGVAGGLAEYTGVDAVLWRVAFLALTIGGGSGILVYALLWLLLPADEDQPLLTTAALPGPGTDATASVPGPRHARCGPVPATPAVGVRPGSAGSGSVQGFPRYPRRPALGRLMA